MESPHKGPVTQKMFPIDDIRDFLDSLIKGQPAVQKGFPCHDVIMRHQYVDVACWMDFGSASLQSSLGQLLVSG